MSIQFDNFLHFLAPISPNLWIDGTKERLIKYQIERIRFKIEKIKLNNKFKLKNISEFPKTDNFNLLYELKYDFVFSGILYLSRIQFDEQKQSGVLEGGFSFCGKCGRWFNIFIKKANNKWVIDKVEGTWVS